MLLLLLIFLKTSFFLSNVAALGIMIQPDTIVGQPSMVLWTREPGDGSGDLLFDLRFTQGFKDVGLAVSNVEASPSTQFGTVQVVFTSPGHYELVAVSGPGATFLGRSEQVNVFALQSSTTSASPTSTSQPVPSATTSVQRASTTSGAGHKKDVGAIIGGTIGGVAFLGLLVALVVVFLRRRQLTEKKRWTFHRDMMIRPAANPDPGLAPPIITDVSRPRDVEQGSPDDRSPTEVMIASPSGPRPLIKYREQPLPPAPLTPRQEIITKQMDQVRKQMMELERNAGPREHIMLDDMQRQMSWLQAQLGSSWALGLTDVIPLGFAPNLAPENL